MGSGVWGQAGGGLDKILVSSTNLKDRILSLLLKIAKILNTGKSPDSELDVIDRDTDFFSQGLSRKIDSAEVNDQRSSLLSLVESVREHSPQIETSDNDSIFSNDNDPEDSIDTLLDDLQAYVLERPAPDWAIIAPKKHATDFYLCPKAKSSTSAWKLAGRWQADASWTCHWLSVFSITGELIDERRKSQLYLPEQAKRRVKNC